MTEKKQETSLLDVVARVARSLKGAIQSKLEQHNVHAGQNFILECLWKKDGLTPGQIAVAIGVEGPTVVRALQRMEAAGIIVRKKHTSDKRQTMIHLTAAGSRLRTHIPKKLEEVEEQALAKFSHDERAQLFALLNRLGANLDT